MVEVFNQPLITGALTLLPVVGLALSKGMRRIALENANFQCQSPLEDREGPLQCSYMDHTKTPVPMIIDGTEQMVPYDDPRRVRVKCLFHHLSEHLTHFGTNGLNNYQNWWSINMLQRKLNDFRKK